MFERFSQEARQVVVNAREEAGRLHHGFIGPEHLLLALSASADTQAGQALAALGLDAPALRDRVTALTSGTNPQLDADALAGLGIDLDTVRRAAEASFGPGALDRGSQAPRRLGGGRPGGGRPRGVRVPFTPRARKVLELALRNAVKRHDTEICTGHMLLGIMDQHDSAALRVLREAGVDAGRLRQELTSRMAA
jgi:ATP-dependent Clp protease ATP-binding subunit ClpA